MKELETRHDLVGGVTDRVARCSWVCREKEDMGFTETPSVTTTLGSVLKCDVGGTPVRDRVEPGTPNSAEGMLHWEDRGGPVLAHCVFPRSPRVRQNLTGKELADALDCPADIYGTMDEDQARKWALTEPTPGKLLGWALGPLRTLNRESRINKRKRAESNEMDDDLATEVEASSQLKGVAEVSEDWSWDQMELNAHGGADEGIGDQKAVKSDDAAVPVDLWNERVARELTRHWTASNTPPKAGFNNPGERDRFARVLNAMRTGCLRRWKKNVRRSFF